MARSDFAVYAEARWSRLVRSARLLGCSPEDAEDVAQTALLQTMRAWSRVERAGDIDAYVYRILVNAYLKSRQRAARVIPRSVVDEDRVVSVDHDVSLGVTVEEALSRLPTKQRSVLVLRFYSDLTEQQTAEVLGIAVGTVKSRASRALARLSQDPSLSSLHG